MIATKKCTAYIHIPYTPKITGHEWVVEENLCCTVLYRWSSRDVWYIFGQIQKNYLLFSLLLPASILTHAFTLVDIRSIQSSALRSVPFSIIASFIQLIDKIPNHQVCIKSLWIMTYDKLLMKNCLTGFRPPILKKRILSPTRIETKIKNHKIKTMAKTPLSQSLPQNKTATSRRPGRVNEWEVEDGWNPRLLYEVDPNWCCIQPQELHQQKSVA